MKVALIGYGKMGKEIEKFLLERGHQIALIIDKENSYQLTKESLYELDVAIEFTGPHSAKKNIEKCLLAGIPVVSGSTGWYAEMHDIERLTIELKGALLCATNFSVGVNIFFEINKRLASLMNHQSNYQVSIEETHHTEKLDAPSGTSITLAEQIMDECERKKRWVNQASIINDEIGIVSHRINPAPGTHVVSYKSTIDDIEIIHTAHNRQGFALGAVIAAEYIANKKGIFTMKDVLGL